MRYTVGTRNLAELLRLALEIRRFDPDVVVYLLDPRPLMNVWRDRIFFLLCGVRRIVGLPSRDQLDYRFDAATQLYESEARRLARAIAVLGDAHVDDLSNWSLHLQSDELDVADRLLSPFASMPIIVCAPGCKMQANDWEQHNWRALLGRLYRRYPSHALVMSGAKEDAEVCDFAALDWGAAKLNLAGKLSPRESAAVFARAAVFIGPDSGPKHLAASMGVPCVCVFSARNLPGTWFPPGSRNQIIYHQTECFGCGLVTCTEMAKKCIRSVQVDEVEQAVDRVLAMQA